MNLSEATTKNMLSKIPTSVIVDALKEREGVKEINLKMTCKEDFRGYDRCLVIKDKKAGG